MTGQQLVQPLSYAQLIDRSLGWVAAAPVLAQILGSFFNIWYNATYVQPVLTAAQLAVFWQTVKLFNGIVYPIGVGLWIWSVWSLRRPWLGLQTHQSFSTAELTQAQRRVINLPWFGGVIAGVLWFLCIPVFLLALAQAPGEINPRIWFDLPVSFVIAGLIAVTHGFFLVEISSQRLLYPHFFQETQPFQVPGAFPLSLRWRSVLFALCGGVCPIISLLLLSLAPHNDIKQDVWFAIAVGSLGIIFNLSSAWMVEQLVIEPIKLLQRTAAAVTHGNLSIRLEVSRADEFGPLIKEFNQMVAQLQENRILQETFGRHVGELAAIQILRRDPSLGGMEQELTILFADLRNFTQRCSTLAPQEVVALLNLFLTDMVEIVERQYDGMVNKFLGDGFMALFGVGSSGNHHGTQAVEAALAMQVSLAKINYRLEREGKQPLAMGIGIHTGRAVVGSIGSDRRMEYTAIGDAVNVAARVEALTKVVGHPLLVTQATQKVLPANILTDALPPQWVKGKALPLRIFAVKNPELDSETTCNGC